MKNYTTVFFDLDHTLWDFNKNSRDALEEIFHKYKLNNHGLEFDLFLKKYTAINHNYWEKYRNNKITKEELRIGRFKDVLKAFNVNSLILAEKMANDYIRISPTKKNLFAGSVDILKYLKNKNYKTAIITNGFEEVQYTKIKCCNIEKYFDAIITSESVGIRKPHKGIFKHALNTVKSDNNEAIMIGDDIESDMIGSRKSNIDQVYFNPLQIKHNYKFTYEIKLLTEIKKIL